MSKRTLRIVFALLLAVPFIVVPALPATADTPITLDVSDGYTFSGVSRSTATGAEEFEQVSPIGPFTQSGNQTQVLLSWTRAVSTTFLNCTANQAVTYTSDSVTNRVALHYSVDKSGTPGPISSIEVRAPEVDAAPAGTSTIFPLNDLAVIANFVDANGTPTSIALELFTSTGGEDARWVGTFLTPVDVTDTFALDVTFIGQAQPPLEGDPDVNSLNCPPPNDDLVESTDFGRSQLILRNQYVVLNVEEQVGNYSPSFDPIAHQTVNEGESLSIDVTATDLDGDNLRFSVEGLPLGASFLDNGNGTSAFSWTPGFDAAGTSTMTVRVTDDGNPALFDEQTFTITVGNVNQAPHIDSFEPVTFNAGDTVTITLETSDPDDDDLTISGDAPAFCAINDHGDSTGNVECAPTQGDAGSYPITITVTDNGEPPLSDTETITITVESVNDPPVLDPIPDQAVSEGQLLTVPLNATGAAGSILTLEAVGLPLLANLIENGDGTGSFEWTPDFDAAGTYTVTVRVTDDGEPALSSEDTFTVAVIDVNRNPNLDPINDVMINEGETTVITINGTDEDGDVLLITGDLPDFASIEDNEDGTGTLTVSPGFDESGLYTVSVSITDDGTPRLDDTQTITITINDVNRPPVLDAPAAVNLSEGEQTTISVTAIDPDGDGLSFSFEGPVFCLLSDNGDDSAEVICDPPFDASGQYDGQLVVNDDGTLMLDASQDWIFTVSNTNRDPVINPVAGVEVQEGQSVTFTVSGSDPDGDSLAYEFDLPEFATFVDNGDGTASVTLRPGATDAGDFLGTAVIVDNGQPVLSAGTSYSIKVNAVNDPPRLDPIETAEVVRGQPISAGFVAIDPEGQPVSFSMSGPSFCTLTDGGDGTAEFSCDTSTAASGTHTVTIVASDGGVQTAQAFDVRVLPNVDANGPYTVPQGQSVELSATGPADVSYAWDLNNDGPYDVDGRTVTFNASGFSAGGHTVRVQARSLDGTTSNTDAATVNVIPGSSAPTITPLQDAEWQQGNPFSFIAEVQATDPDGAALALSVAMEPHGELYLNFNDNGDGTGVITVNTAVLPRKYTLTVTASDGANPVTEEFILTVTPAVDGGGPYFVLPGGSVTLEPSSSSATLFSYDRQGDGFFEASGPSYTFVAGANAQPGPTTVTVKGCLPDGEVCTIVAVEVIVEHPPTFDELQDLTRDAVGNFIAERTLVTLLGLAEFFDANGAIRAAQALLEAYIRLVIGLAFGGFIGLEDAELMVDFADYLLSQYEE